MPETILSGINNRMIISLGDFVASQFEEAKNNKETTGVNERLLKSLRQYNGIYDDNIKAGIQQMGGTDVYRRLTALKCDTLVAWINEILLDPNDEFWELSPTPIPDLPERVKMNIISQTEQAAVQEFQAMQGQMDAQMIQQFSEATAKQLKDTIYEKMKKAANEKVIGMQKQILDQLIDGKYNNMLYDFFCNYSKFQTAFAKGPLVRIEKMLSWKSGKVEVIEKPVLTWYAPSPLDMYNSPDADNINQGRIFEVVRYTRDELYMLMEVPNYNKSAIRRLLSSKKSPVELPDDYISTERRELEDKPYVIDPLSRTKFEGVEMWGSVPGYLLKSFGIDVKDVIDSYEAHVIKIGNEVILATLNEDPLKRRPYYMSSYQYVPGDFWGISLPESMEDIQRECNAAMRALCDNLAISSGPMTAYDLAQLPPDTDITKLYPWKIFTFDGTRSFNTRKAVEFFQPNSNANELLNVYNSIRQEADNVTSIPAFSAGATNISGAGEALADYEKVLTPKGSIEICDLKPGDYVLNTYGSKSKVLAVYPQGKKDIFRIKFSNNETVDCDINHRWSVSDHPERGFKTMTIKELLEKGLYRKTIKGYRNPTGMRPKWCLPKIEYIDYKKKKVKIDPYTMGALIGDGDARCRLISEDKEIFDRIPYELGKIDLKRGENAYARTIMGIKNIYHSYGLNCKSLYKFIPDDYLYNSKEIRLELLRGLMDTDGCCSKKGHMIFLSTSSERLRDDFIRLVKSLGATSVGVTSDKAGEGLCRGRVIYRKVNYRIKFNLDHEKVFHLERKQSRVRSRTRNHIYITGIELIGKNTATCITVDSKNHLFICDNYIPTHNTASGLSILQSNMTKGIKNHVLTISKEVISPSLKRMYDWNMIYNEDESIKGDAQVVVKGPLKVTTREQKQLRLNEFMMATNNPVDLQIMGNERRANLLREQALVLDLPVEDIVPSKEELRRTMEAQQQAMSQQQMMEQQPQQ